MTLLRLNCIRCGDWDEMDPADLPAYGLGLCMACRARIVVCGDKTRAEIRLMGRRFRRYQREMERHPTFKALTTALDNLHEPGTLEAGHV
jgi:hypothetical protein